VIIGLQGNHTIKRLDGNDLICGGSGKDTLVAVGEGIGSTEGRGEDTCKASRPDMYRLGDREESKHE
jgi:Ca2+-binding RTX toxin-like protein